MKRDAATERQFKPITYKNVLFFLGLFALFGCPCLNGEDSAAYDPPRSKMIFAAGVPALSATNEEFTVTVRTSRAAGEQVGQMVTITPTVPAGVTVTPPTRQLALVSGELATTFLVRTPASGYTRLAFNVSRTDHSIENDKSVFTATPLSGEVIPNLVSITYDPTSLVMNRGTSVSLNVRVLPRGNTSGPVLVAMDHNLSGITLSPPTFVVNLTQGATTPVNQLVTVSAAANSYTGTNQLRSSITWSQTSYDIASVPITINAGTGTPHFTFTATPLQVTSAIYEESPTVTFTLTSQNGFSGDVVVDPDADGETGIIPTVGAETFTVIPGTPTTFTRRFQRYYGTNDIHVTFTATHAASSTSRQVVITMKHP
jgi:hypothetical protein